MITTTFTAKEAKNNFGRLLDEARHSPVAVEKNGRRVAIVMSVEKYSTFEAEEDVRWGRRAEHAHKKGYIGAAESKRLLDDLMRANQRLTWRQKELEADADIRAGRVSKKYRTIPALKRALVRFKP